MSSYYLHGVKIRDTTYTGSKIKYKIVLIQYYDYPQHYNRLVLTLGSHICKVDLKSET
jgi:hypothetical protein